MNIKDLKGCFANITDDELLRDNGNLYAENKEKDKEIERLNNIIKEVREYIEKYNSISGYYYDNKVKRENDYLCCKEDILRILDKGE